MHAIAKTFAIAFASVSAAAAVGVGLADRLAAADAGVAPVARVAAVGPRADTVVITRLPRVVVEVRRAMPADVTTAAARAPARPA